MNVVDNSIQAEFGRVNNEINVLRNAAAAAERDRRREEEQLRNLRSTQMHLEESLRIAHTELGTVTRKQKILEDERKRLMQVMESDRQSIVKITSELKGIEADEKKQKLSFVKEMETLNNEIDLLLTQCENKKTLRLIDLETVNWLVETKISIMTNKEDPVESYSVENEKWNAIATKIKESLEALVDAQKKHAAGVKEKVELENLVRGLRSKFLSENNVGVLDNLMLRSTFHIPFFTILYRLFDSTTGHWGNGN